jgi:hypothetical protein
MASYVWLSGPQFAGSTSKCITVTVAGAYALQITDTNGCSAICRTTLVNTNAQACGITGNLSICTNRTTVLTAANGMISYAWTGPNSFTAASQTIVVGTQGTYTVTQVDGRGLTNVCSVYLTVNCPPKCAITGTQSIICMNPTTLCGPTGLRSQYWLGPQNNGLNTRCNTISIPGTYTLVMTDSNGCQRACTVNVPSLPCPDR